MDPNTVVPALVITGLVTLGIVLAISARGGRRRHHPLSHKKVGRSRRR